MSKQISSVLVLLLSIVMLNACAVHKLDIQQGNVLTQESLATIKIGMEANQVRRLIGTPLMVNPFRSTRWDYYYSFKHGKSGETQTSHVSLFFKEDKVSEIKVHKTPVKEQELNSLHKKIQAHNS